MKKIFYDTEFLDTGKYIHPISLAMVEPDSGEELYLIVEDAPWRPIISNTWLRENVVKHLPMKIEGWDGDLGEIDWNWDDEHPDKACVAYRDSVAGHVEDFLKRHGGPEVELWVDYPATDHVLLYQLFGPMIKCTSHGMPMRTNCLVQEEATLRRVKGYHLAGEKPEQDPATEHHALHDARHNVDVARWLGVIS